MKTYKKALIFYLVASVIFVIIYFITDSLANRKIDQLNVDYPLLKKEQELHSTVSHIYKARGFRIAPSTAVITLDDLVRTTIGTQTNYGVDYNLADVLNIGDSLVKKANSDTLWVIKKQSGKRFIFLINIEKSNE